VVPEDDNGLLRVEQAAEPCSGAADYDASAGDAGHRTSLQLGQIPTWWAGRRVQPASRAAVCGDGGSVDERHDASAQNVADQHIAAVEDRAGTGGESWFGGR